MTTVLIADDLDVGRRALARVLTRAGYRVIEAADGDEALRILRAERADLAIVDLLMPTLDGFELVREIRKDADAAVAKTPVIFYSAHFPADEAMSLASALGVSLVLMKGRPPEEILEGVRRATSSEETPEATLAPWEFTKEHSRLISAKLAEGMEGFVTALGDYLGAGKPEGEEKADVEGGGAGRGEG